MFNKTLTKKIYSIIILVLLAVVANFVPVTGIYSNISSYNQKENNASMSSDFNSGDFSGLPTNTLQQLKSSSTPNVVFYSNIGQLNDSNILYYYSSPLVFVGFLKSMIFYKVRSTQTEQFESFNVSFPSSRTSYPTAIGRIGPVINLFEGSSSYTQIKTFSDIYYYNIYQNIDLHFYFTKSGLKYEFISSGKTNQIKIKVSSNVNLDINPNTVSLEIRDKKVIFDSGLKVYTQDSNKVISSSFIRYDN